MSTCANCDSETDDVVWIDGYAYCQECMEELGLEDTDD